MDYMHDIDKYDDDVKENEERMKIPFTLNFKTISTYMFNLQEGLKEVTDDYPKKDLIKLMVGIEIVLAILIIFSYNIFVIVTLPLMLFYFLALRSVYKSWKACKYPKWKFILPTVLVILVSAVAAYFIQDAIF